MTTMVVTTGMLNMRERPDTEAPVIKRLRLFDRIDADGEEGDWIRVAESGGWMFSQYLAKLDHESLCVGFVLSEEGGLSMEPSDPGNWTGGERGKGFLKGTKYGISALAYPDVDIANLTLARAREIYEKEWIPGYIKNPWPLSLYRFDAAVNMGPYGEDHIFRQWNKRDLPEYLLLRRRYYEGLAGFSINGKAWLSRVDRIGQFAKTLTPVD